MLSRNFGSTPAWMSVEPCPEDTGQAQRQKLWFFPVDNTRAQRDPTIRSLMRTIEKVTRNEEYIKKKVGCHSPPSSILPPPPL